MASLLILVVLGLASYRATHLVVHDSIADPIRDRLFAWHAKRPDSTPRTLLTDLISCTYCTGWWLSGAMLAAWLTATGGWPTTGLLDLGVQWFAVAGVQALANRWNDTRGHHE